jgi:transposase
LVKQNKTDIFSSSEIFSFSVKSYYKGIEKLWGDEKVQLPFVNKTIFEK